MKKYSYHSFSEKKAQASFHMVDRRLETFEYESPSYYLEKSSEVKSALSMIHSAKKIECQRFQIMHVLSEETSSEWQGLRGRINAEMFPVGVQDYFVFVCGPDGFVLSATK